MTAPTSRRRCPGPKAQGASSRATARSSRRPTRAAIRSSSRAASGAIGRGRRRQPLPRLRRRHRRQLHRPLASRRRRRRSPSRRRSSCTCRAPTSTTSRRCASPRSWPAIAPIQGGVRSFFGNSGTEAIEACVKLARYATRRHEHHRVPRRVPRPHDGVAVADGEQGDPAPRLRAAACRACITRRIRTAIAVRSG